MSGQTDMLLLMFSLFCERRQLAEPISANTMKIFSSETDMAAHVASVSPLYRKRVPDLARRLDGMVDLPFDSLSLSVLLHDAGLGIGQVGVLFSICRSPPVRQLLLVEMLSRSFKTIVGRKLRALTRDMKSRSDLT